MSKSDARHPIHFDILMDLSLVFVSIISAGTTIQVMGNQRARYQLNVSHDMILLLSLLSDWICESIY